MSRLLSGFFQHGYVTPDLDRAMAEYRARFDVTDFWVFDTIAARPDDPHPNRVALAWIGDVMVELIQPLREPAPLYAPEMPAQGIRLHHLGYRIDDQARWDEVMARLAVEAMPIVRSGGNDSFQYAYADARGALGHCLEFVWSKAGKPDFFVPVPRN
jgi:hypothetical protein